jgi:DNA uptake protein ComE-like DNA-binding protein
MNFKDLFLYFVFTRNQRFGIVGLFSIIIFLQLAYFFIDFSIPKTSNPNEQKWLYMQSQIDSLEQESPSFVYKIYPYNPNFITDFKGYKLGMCTAEIDRLLAFRKSNKFANSPKEFQAVTKISDSLLNAMSPYFKFPNWVNNKKENNYQDFKNSNYKDFTKKEKIIVLDINLATKEDLMKISGIGEAISDRILKQKETFGGFQTMEQMNDVWGLSPEVIQKLNESFKIGTVSSIKKININNATLKELTLCPYFRYTLAKQIVIYRSMNGDFKNIEELTKIKDFPVDKIKRIALYLEL